MHLRRHLRVWAALSLVLQSAWLFALVPRDCCAAHRKTSDAPACHQEVEPTHCPMSEVTGAACPMHGPEQAHRVADECSMRNSCTGPMAALLSLLSGHAILAFGPMTLSEPHAVARDVTGGEQLVTRFVSPDSPPPRS